MVDKAAQQTKGQKVDTKPRRCKKNRISELSREALQAKKSKIFKVSDETLIKKVNYNESTEVVVVEVSVMEMDAKGILFVWCLSLYVISEQSE